MEPYRTPDPGASPEPRSQGDVDATLRKRSPQGWRIGLLLVLLAVLIVALDQLLRAGPAPSGVGIWIALGVALIFGVAFGWMLRRTMKLIEANQAAVAVLAAGRIDEAIASFVQLAESSRRYPSLRAQFLANLGTSWLRKGDLDRALTYLRAAYDSRWLETPRHKLNLSILLSALSICHTIRDQLEAARQFARDAQQQVPPTQRGLLLPCDALVAARAGEFGEVAAMTLARWNEAEGCTSPFHMRLLRLIRAYALVKIDGEKNAREIQTLLDGARPSRPGEFDYLLGSWPELRSFLSQHEFATAA